VFAIDIKGAEEELQQQEKASGRQIDSRSSHHNSLDVDPLDSQGRPKSKRILGLVGQGNSLGRKKRHPHRSPEMVEGRK